MRVLFFIVHPSKYHLFKNSLPLLNQAGIEYEFVIAGKDILATLLRNAGIPFTDLFPAGRKKHRRLPFVINAGINLAATLFKLYRYARGKKFNVFVTDDVLAFLGKLMRVPTIVFTDNDLATIPKVQAIFKYADRILTPKCTDLGKYTAKKTGFHGVKAVAHLHPRYFQRDPAVLKKYGLEGKKLCIIRVARLNASHDLHGNPGITDEHLGDLIALAGRDFEIVISAERETGAAFKKHIRNIGESDFTQVMAHASFFAGDSGTMATEAAVLGIPNVLINNVAKLCGVHRLLWERHNLQHYFDTYEDARDTIAEMLSDSGIQQQYAQRAREFLATADDFNELLVQTINEIGIQSRVQA